MELKFKKLHADAVLPKKAHATDAGLDLTCISRKFDIESGCLVYGTGLAVEIPEGHVGLLFPRSSIYKYYMSLTNCVGVIDSGYRGEIRAMMRPVTRMVRPLKMWDRLRFFFCHKVFKDPTAHNETVTDICEVNGYQKGDRIVQLIVMPIPEVQPVWADELSDSDRGKGGYGSSGR